jgi:hypothetical protein
MLKPQEEDTEDPITEKNADLGKVGIKTLNIVLNNTAKNDVKMTQKITKEIERWDVINIQVQDALDKIGKAAIAIQEKAAGILQLSKLVPDKDESEKLKKIAEEISALAKDDVENSSEELSEILGKYKPFNGKKKIKVVIIRPQKSFGVDTLEFDKAGEKADEIIRLGYEAGLNSLLQSKLLKKDKYQKLMQEPPYPVGNIFSRKPANKMLSEVV